ncbi:MAG: menaquinone biosynthesis protein [Bacteroidota bacterium]
MIRIALVEYINTRPFLDGLVDHFHAEEVELLLLPPMDCARALQEGRADLALMPVGALTNFDQVDMLPDFCIGADGPVHSVFLFAQRPVAELKEIRLDPHSRSSNGLLRILMQHHWQRQLHYHMPSQRDFSLIQGTVGGVAIGDEAIKIRDRYEYVYDLSASWQDLTGLPFAFAVWVHRRGALSEHQRQRIFKALQQGVAQREETALRWHEYFGLARDFSLRYLTEYIDYQFTPAKHRAVQLYLRNLKRLPQLALQAV